MRVKGVGKMMKCQTLNSKIDFQYTITSYCLSFLTQNQYFDKGNLLTFTDNNDL